MQAKSSLSSKLYNTFHGQVSNALEKEGCCSGVHLGICKRHSGALNYSPGPSNGPTESRHFLLVDGTQARESAFDSLPAISSEDRRTSPPQDPFSH